MAFTCLISVALKINKQINKNPLFYAVPHFPPEFMNVKERKKKRVLKTTDVSLDLLPPL